MARGRFIKSGCDNFGTASAHRALHLGDFLGSLINEQYDHITLRVIGDDGLGDVLHHDGLAGFGRRDEQPALALANGRHQIDQPPGEVLSGAIAFFQRESLIGEKRREVFEKNLALGAFRGFKVDVLDFEQCEVPLGVLGRPDHARHRIPGAEIETPYLAGADINIVRSCQKGTVGRSQKPKAILKNLEDTVAPNIFSALGVPLEQCKNDVLLARAGHIFNAHFPGHINQFLRRLVFQVGQAHRVRAGYIGIASWTTLSASARPALVRFPFPIA